MMVKFINKGIFLFSMTLESKCLAGVLSLPVISISVLLGNALVSECSKDDERNIPASRVESIFPEEGISYKRSDVDENGCKIDPTFVPWKNEEEINTARKAFIRNSYRRIVKEQNIRFDLGNFKAPPYSIRYANQGEGIPRDAGVYDFKTGQILLGYPQAKKAVGQIL